MRDLSGANLEKDPAAHRARKRPVVCKVEFAAAAGQIDTMEGPVSHLAGDAIVTGVSKERWPIAREKFLRSYEPVGATKAGMAGRYRKRPILVWARPMNEPFSVKVGSSADTIEGDAGDWLLQYGAGEYGVVDADVFEKSYELLD
jgi:hypothetical protein